jgi:hypothetical protein
MGVCWRDDGEGGRTGRHVGDVTGGRGWNSVMPLMRIRIRRCGKRSVVCVWQGVRRRLVV